MPDIELAREDLPLRPSNFIVGIEEMPVRFTPQAPRSGARSEAKPSAAWAPAKGG
jgi:hypothetical protein